MHTRGGRTTLPASALLIVAVLLGACSSAPQSGVTESAAPSSAAPSATSAAPTGAPSAAPSDAVATPDPTPEATPGIPPKPGKVTFREVDRTNLKGGAQRATYRLKWTSPAGVATSFTVYGVTECLRASKQTNGKPCVVRGMRIPKGTLKLLATVPGSARTVDISWKEGEAGPGPYAAVLVRASNDAGDSIFTIAWSQTVCWACVY